MRKNVTRGHGMMKSKNSANKFPLIFVGFFLLKLKSCAAVVSVQRLMALKLTWGKKYSLPSTTWRVNLIINDVSCLCFL